MRVKSTKVKKDSIIKTNDKSLIEISNKVLKPRRPVPLKIPRKLALELQTELHEMACFDGDGTPLGELNTLLYKAMNEKST